MEDSIDDILVVGTPPSPRTSQLLATPTLASPPALDTPLGMTSETSGKKASKFLISAKKLFLTWPICSTKKEQVETNLLKMWSHPEELKWYLIAEEKHQNGEPHLHVGLEFVDKMHFKGEKGLKILNELTRSELHPNGKHGDYSAMKNVRGSVTYLTKEGNFIAKGIDPASVLQKKGKGQMHEIVDRMVQEALTPQQILAESPYEYFRGRRHILDFYADLQMQKRSKTVLKELRVILPQAGMNKSTSGSALLTWLNGNLIASSRLGRQIKTKQLWLFGAPNIGKSRMFSLYLKPFLRQYTVPHHDFYCEYGDDAYDVAILDEYNGWKTITWLNQWLEGTPLVLNQKNKPAYTKQFNIPTVILSNLSPHQVYQKVPPIQLEALLTRLEVIEMKDEILLECY